MCSLIKGYRFIYLVLFAMVINGCNKEDMEANLIRIHFDHTVDGTELNLNSSWYESAVGHSYQVTRLKYYTSNFTLRNQEGELLKAREVHYRDVEKPDTRTFNWEDLPPGEYTSISFLIGLDEEVNVDGGLENTTTNINMEWPLPGDQGYHYMKFEGYYEVAGSGEIKPYNLHTGASGNHPYYVFIDIPFDNPVKMSGGEWDIRLNMDLNEWLQNPHTYDFEAFGSMIMGNQNAQQVLMENGRNVFSLVRIE